MSVIILIAILLTILFLIEIFILLFLFEQSTHQFRASPEAVSVSGTGLESLPDAPRRRGDARHTECAYYGESIRPWIREVVPGRFLGSLPPLNRE
jgi:hypothetical protein